MGRSATQSLLIYTFPSFSIPPTILTLSSNGKNSLTQSGPLVGAPNTNWHFMLHIVGIVHSPATRAKVGEEVVGLQTAA